MVSRSSGPSSAFRANGGGSYWRTYDLWYGKARRVEEYEIDAIADALRVKREREAANELHELRTRLARVIDAADRREDRRNGRDRSGMAS